MSETDTEVHELFTNLVPKVSVKVRPDIDPNEVKYEYSSPNAWYISDMYFLDLKFGEDNQVVKLVVKVPPKAEAVRILMKSERQFHNEILFYRSVEEHEITDYPRCFYTQEILPYDSVIVLENLGEHGYHGCPSKNDAPMDYVLAAMHEIGKFHGRSYAIKEKQRNKFLGIVNGIQEVRYERGQIDDEENLFRTFVNHVASRPIKYLKQKGYDSEFCEKMERYLSEAYENIMIPPVRSSEPLTTLIHGDFTSNNVLFKEETKDKFQAKLIDFALINYALPSVDLSTFLFVSCSNKTRDTHFNEIFQTYHRALSDYLKKAGIWDEDKYSYQSFLNDYKRHALFGLVIAIFFWPKLLGLDTLSFDDILGMDIMDVTRINFEAGGDELSSEFADAVLELRKHGALDFILKRQ